MESQRKSLGQEDMNLEPVLRTTLMSEKPYKRVKHLIFLVSCLCLSPFYYGFTLTYISTINDHTLKVYFGPEAARSVMIGILIGIVPAGAGVGALLAPFFMTLFTRR
jgi:zinc transporter ZupT